MGGWLVTITTTPRRVGPVTRRGRSIVGKRRSAPVDADSGPIDILLIGFDGNEFNPAIWPALRALILRDVVRVIDVLFVYKDAHGVVGSIDVDALRPTLEHQRVDLDGQFERAVLDAEDVDEIGSGLAPNRSMVVLAIENTWALPFVGAVQAAGGELVDHARVPSESRGDA
jgi:hypothetical protein